MNLLIRNIAGGAGAIALVAVSFALVSSTLTYSHSLDPASMRSFSVTGEAERSVVPDVATITVGVVTQGGTDLEDTQTKNSEVGNAVISFIKGKGGGR